MCDTKCGCDGRKKAVKNPAKCTPVQIKKCHGPVKKHPCVKK